MLTWRMAELKSALTSQGEPTGLGLKEKEEEKSTQGHFWKIQSRKVNWAWAQLITTPTRPINNCYSHPSPISRPKSQAQSVLGPEESKAQLKWAPATSKDGSDHDPPSPVTTVELSTCTRRAVSIFMDTTVTLSKLCLFIIFVFV